MMTGDLYSLLGVRPTATAEEIKAAYRSVARRFHPDANHAPSAAEEFKRITEAYAVLSDPARRQSYDDAMRKARSGPLVNLQCIFSREELPLRAEPQVLYALVDIHPAYRDSGQLGSPAINLCVAIDRSTSMQGLRLDQVKAAVLETIDGLREHDIFSVVTYSDKAEVVIPAQANLERTVAKAKVSTLAAKGGTEILEGLMCGLGEIQRHVDRASVNHLILLTDGRTYGDEAECLLLASLAANDGITVSGLGIGDEWNDRFLDELTAITGGTSTYIQSPQQVRTFIHEQVRGLGSTFAERLMLTVTTDAGVQLLSAFKLGQEVGPVPVEDSHLRIGALAKHQGLSVLLRFQVSPTSEEGPRPVARLGLFADVVSLQRGGERITADIVLPVVRHLRPIKPPTAIVNALGKLSQYNLQERAWQDAAAGDIQKATERLSVLGTRLLSAGQTGLAKAALAEARRLEQTQLISEEAKKNIKYGTRALMLAPPK